MGVRKTDDRREKFCLGELFSQKSISYKKFWLVLYELSKGVHTKDDGNRKYAYILNFFLRLIFFEKMFWITLFLVGEQSVKVTWKKAFFRVYFFIIENYIHIIFFERFCKTYQWGYTGMLKKSFFFWIINFSENRFSWVFLNDIVISGGTEDRW